jgi:ornithine--oxo-acid transaminase
MTATVDNQRSAAAVAEADQWTAHNYHPLPVVIADAEGAWVTDVDGKRYLDCLAAYSALNFGHRHPLLVAAARSQLDHVTLTSRAFLHDQFGPFCRELAELCSGSQSGAAGELRGSGSQSGAAGELRGSGSQSGAAGELRGTAEMVLPMNTGAEAVETAIKVARAWGYRVKGVPDGQATIVVADGNFHGRTTTIVSFSTDPEARAGFGPYTPGFRIVPYGDLAAMAEAIDDTTVAVLIEPIQGEAGVIVPPEGYLVGVRSLCTSRNVLFVADEIQSGLGRTGDTFAVQHDGLVPDLYVLGKALGGGVVPVSAVVGRRDVLGVLRPGEHGSTFGGNPLACAVGRAVVALLRTGEYQERARRLGAQLHERLGALVGHGVVAVRGRGLWAGVDIDPALMTGREASERLMARGLLAKDTHGSTIRLAPPLVVTADEVHWAVDQLSEVVAGG